MSALSGVFALGRDLRLSINGKPVAGSETCDFEITAEIETVATKDSPGKSKEKIQTGYTFKVMTKCKYTKTPGTTRTSHKELINAIITGASITFKFGDGLTGSTEYSGKVIAASMKIGAPDLKTVSFDASFEGDGDIIQTDVV